MNFDEQHRSDLVRIFQTVGSSAVYERSGIGTLNVWAIIDASLSQLPDGFNTQVSESSIGVDLLKNNLPINGARRGDKINVGTSIYTVDSALTDDGFVVRVICNKTADGSIDPVLWSPEQNKLDGLDYFNFTWEDRNKRLFDIQKDKLVAQVTLHIQTPFNGSGTKIQLGDLQQPDRLMTEYENNPSEVGSYLVHPNYSFAVLTTIFLNVIPGNGCGQGQGIIEIQYQD